MYITSGGACHCLGPRLTEVWVNSLSGYFKTMRLVKVRNSNIARGFERWCTSIHH
jgi:hypothetical protein